MKKLIFIPLLFLFVFCEAQFTKGGGGFLKTGSSFMTAPTVSDPYGPEKITNGTFTSTSSWTINASAFTITTGTPGYITYGDAANNQSFFQSAVQMVSQLEVSTNYRLTFTLTVASAGTAYFDIATVTGAFMIANYAAYTSGDIVITFTTPGSLSENGFALWGYTASTNTWTIANISLKEVL